MGNNKHFSRASAFAVGVCMCAAITHSTQSSAAGKRKPQAAPATAAAPAQPDDAAQKQKEAAAAHASYEAGVKSYQAGKLEPAVESPPC